MSELLRAWEAKLEWDMRHSIDPHRRAAAAQMLDRIDDQRRARALGWRIRGGIYAPMAYRGAMYGAIV